MDAFRRPKFSYYMFQAQATGIVEPMVFIANELTPFSSQDVTVFSNCASVRLTTFFGEDSVRMGVKESGERWYTFAHAWDFMQDKWLSRANPSKQRKAYILAEGLDHQGNVVATDRREQSRRASRLEIIVDTMSAPFTANGGDLVVVTARMTDNWGNVKRLNNEFVRFSIQGEGSLMADAATQTNPVTVLWGEASILVRSTTRAGKVRIKASVLLQGDNTPLSAEVEFRSTVDSTPMIYDPKLVVRSVWGASAREVSSEDRVQIEAALREVEAQQTSFGEAEKK